MRNKNKITENDVRMVWMQKQVMMCWFVTSATFCAKWLKLLTVIFFSRIDGKQQNDRKFVEKIWVKNVVILGWFLFLAGFRV